MRYYLTAKIVYDEKRKNKILEETNLNKNH